MNLFVLTPEEKRVVAFIMLMILVGVCVKEYRKRHPPAPVPIEFQKHPWMRNLPPVPSTTPDRVYSAKAATPHPKRSRKPHKEAAPATPLPSAEQPDPDPDSASDTENHPP